MYDGNLRIELLKKSEWNNISSLSVATNQEGFIETSAKCLDDAQNDAYGMKWDFYGVYDELNLVGFAMHGRQEFWPLPYSQVWLDRFMIDKKYQGKGYGKQAMVLIIKRLFYYYKCKKIYLSVHADNVAAIKLYENLGFKKTWMRDLKGERIMTRVK